METVGIIADLIGIAGAVFAFFAWIQARQTQQELIKERKRLAKKVIVKLNYGGQELNLPVELRRAELSRAEILGRIGMLPMREPGKRFSLEFTSTPDFLQRLNQVIDSTSEETLIIPCSKEEFEQFKQ
ncbi:hypothetical protein G4Y79_14510 [Phototrophicus methaneseepsis]|uniref:Uncharacterized protein n=1 Tax=Phototrophicus methaneseepsis TaxID=2710758 RepID=A0A7S8E601_9CHLR|nr:hypothetical protein [Phototrophicus methaneseepsis]QPC80918.1 hypothetical protein G4Y79_14510 [Phototrophicus methaneseepsis]